MIWDYMTFMWRHHNKEWRGEDIIIYLSLNTTWSNINDIVYNTTIKSEHDGIGFWTHKRHPQIWPSCTRYKVSPGSTMEKSTPLSMGQLRTKFDETLAKIRKLFQNTFLKYRRHNIRHFVRHCVKGLKIKRYFSAIPSHVLTILYGRELLVLRAGRPTWFWHERLPISTEPSVWLMPRKGRFQIYWFTCVFLFVFVPLVGQLTELLIFAINVYTVALRKKKQRILFCYRLLRATKKRRLVMMYMGNTIGIKKLCIVPYLYIWCSYVRRLQWRHHEHDGVSNHQPHDCLLNHLFKVQIKENIKAPRHWPLWPMTDEFPAQRASNAENVSIWWRHHAQSYRQPTLLLLYHIVCIQWYARNFPCRF